MSIEAMKQALEALERGRSQIIGALVQQDQDEAIASLRQAIEKAEKQEPDELTIAYMSGLYDGKKKREWVGLTEEEITACKRTEKRYLSSQEFAHAIEAKLKEKNAL